MEPVKTILFAVITATSLFVCSPVAAEDAPHFPPVTREHIQAIKDIAADLKKQGDYLTIRRLMDLALQFAPDDWELYKYRGRALKVEGRYAESIADFKKLLSLKEYDYAHLSVVETNLFWSTDDAGVYNATLHSQRVQQALDWIAAHEPNLKMPDVVTLFHLFALVGKTFLGTVVDADFDGFRTWLKEHPLSPRGKKWGFDETIRRIQDSKAGETEKRHLVEMVKLARTT